MAQTTDAGVRVGVQGRLVIPSAIRRRLGFKPGDTLLLRVQGESLVLERRETALARIEGWFDAVPGDVSLVEELLAERRAEVEQEEKE